MCEGEEFVKGCARRLPTVSRTTLALGGTIVACSSCECARRGTAQLHA